MKTKLQAALRELKKRNPTINLTHAAMMLAAQVGCDFETAIKAIQEGF